MWFMLIIVLWGTAPTDVPTVMQPAMFASEAKCQAAGDAAEQALRDAKLSSIAAATIGCKQISNPLTEQNP